MTKRRIQCLGTTLLGAITLLAAVRGNEPDEPRRFASVGMRIKLEYSTAILSGLATGDFKAIAENAKAMRGLNAIEEFARGKSAGYRAQLNVFEAATDELFRAAEKENIDGAALAYTQMTIACVNCHKELRRD